MNSNDSIINSKFIIIAMVWAICLSVVIFGETWAPRVIASLIAVIASGWIVIQVTDDRR